MSKETLTKDGVVDKTKAAKWKKLILAINDRDEIEMIQKLCSARLDIARADRDIEKVGKPEKKAKDGSLAYDPDGYRAPKKMKPVMSIEEPEDMDEIA